MTVALPRTVSVWAIFAPLIPQGYVMNPGTEDGSNHEYVDGSR